MKKVCFLLVLAFGLPAPGLKAETLKETQDSDVNVVTKQYNEAFALARHGKTKEVAAFVAENPEAITIRDRRNRTLLHSAALCAYPGTVRWILEHGGDVSAADQDGATPLHLAMSMTLSSKRSLTPDDPRVPATVKALLEHGASPSITDNAGNTPLHSACQFLQGTGLQSVADQLIAAGAPVEAQNKLGQTALRIALIRSPTLTMAFPKRGPEVGKFATLFGAERDIFSAAGLGDILALDRILEAKDSASMKLKDGTTPLHFAASQKQPQTILLLAKAGFDVNAQDALGQTPLHYALQGMSDGLFDQYLCAETLKALFDAGANPSLKDDNGNTPLHCSLIFGMNKASEAIIAHGGDLKLANNKGFTPDDLIKKKADMDTLERYAIYAADRILSRSVQEAILNKSKEQIQPE